MKVSGFTFLRNGQKLGYPFVASIRSILPLVDEFVIALGPCDDDTEKMVRAIGDPKIRIIPTTWNEKMRGDYIVIVGALRVFLIKNSVRMHAVRTRRVILENDLDRVAHLGMQDRSH